MLVLGSRLLFLAAFAWFYEAGVYLYAGNWPNVAWTDLLRLMGGDYGIDLMESYLRAPAGFLKAPVGTSCFAAGLPLFLFGLSRFGGHKKKVA